MKALSPWFSTARLVEDIRKVLVKQSPKAALGRSPAAAKSTRSGVRHDRA